MGECAESSVYAYDLSKHGRYIFECLNNIGYSNGRNDNYPNLTKRFGLCYNEILPYMFFIRAVAQESRPAVDELRELLDSVDYAIVEQVACSKYLNSLQIFEYITLRGYDVDRPKLRKRILKLMKYRVIQENEMVSAGAEHGLKYYELDYFGYQLALEQGVNFHKQLNLQMEQQEFKKHREKFITLMKKEKE